MPAGRPTRASRSNRPNGAASALPAPTSPASARPCTGSTCRAISTSARACCGRAVLVAWTYDGLAVPPELREAVGAFSDAIRPYWPQERALVARRTPASTGRSCRSIRRRSRSRRTGRWRGCWRTSRAIRPRAGIVKPRASIRWPRMPTPSPGPGAIRRPPGACAGRCTCSRGGSLDPLGHPRLRRGHRGQSGPALQRAPGSALVAVMRRDAARPRTMRAATACRAGTPMPMR